MRYFPRNIRIDCNNSGLARYGGIVLFHEFIQVLQSRSIDRMHANHGVHASRSETPILHGQSRSVRSQPRWTAA